MSLLEILLWHRLRGSPQGVSFRKQHPIDPYSADFYCAAARLVIELDGEAHNRGDRPQRDLVREKFLLQQGYEVVRIAAADVLRDPDETAASIVALAAHPLHRRSLTGGPPPRPGEDHA